MVSMDKKGITWVGNVYKRFEDMCLDVEEDTINYVENQFQSVGESVRRFYSNVMQDFLPPLNSMESGKNSKDENENFTEQGGVKKENEPVVTRTIEDMSVTSPLTHVRRDIDNSCRPSERKIAYSELRSRKSRCKGNNNGNKLDSSFNKNSDPDENLSESMPETREPSRGQMAESNVRHDIDNSCRPSVRKIAYSELRSRKSRGKGNNNGNKLDSSYNKNSDPDESPSESMPETREPSRGQMAESNVRHDIDISCRPSVKIGYSELRSRKSCGKGNNNGNKLVSSFNKNSDPDENLSKSMAETRGPSRGQMAKSNVRHGIDSSCRPSVRIIAYPDFGSRTSRLDSSFNKNSDPDENLSESMSETRESPRCQKAERTIVSSNEMLTTRESVGNNENDNGFRSSNGSELCLNVPVSSIGGSSQDEQIQDKKYADEEIFTSHLNQPTKFFDRNLAITTDPVEESVEKHRSKLEETIVVVNEDDLHSLRQIECKQTTNKKKIRGSLYSVMRSGRKHEYRQLAYSCEDGEKSDDSKKLGPHDFCESEWEIL